MKLLGFGLLVSAGSLLTDNEASSETARAAGNACWEGAVQLAQSIGPTFVKLLQWCTTRRDLFSVEFCDQLAALQHRCDRGGAAARAKAERQLAHAFGDDWREYVDISGPPLGAGCIATVYKGRLGPKGLRMANDAGNARALLPSSEGGVEVAVKVLRDGARDSVFLDLYILDLVVTALEWSAAKFKLDLDMLPMRDSLEDFQKMMVEQLDLQHEARCMARFRERYLLAHDLATKGGGEIFGVQLRLPALLEPLVDAAEELGLRFGVGLGFGAGFGLDRDAETGDPARGRHVYLPSGAWAHRNDASSRFVVPEVYLAPTPSVLVEEFVEGELLSSFLHGRKREELDAAALAAAGSVNAAVQEQRAKAKAKRDEDDALARQLGQIGMHGFLRMIFDDNFIHGDLHPGNMIILRRGDGANLGSAAAHEASGETKLALLDGGIAVELSEQDQWNLIDLFYHVGTGKTYEGGLLFLKNAARSRCTDPEGFARRFEALANTLIEDKFQTTSKELGGLVEGLLDLCREYEVRLDPAFSKVIIAIVVVEGLGKSLDESLDIIREAVPTMARARRRLRARRKACGLNPDPNAPAPAPTAAAAAPASSVNATGIGDAEPVGKGVM